MSMTVHHFSMVLEKIAVANPPLEITKKRSGRLGTQFLPIDRRGTKSTTPGTTLLGSQVRSSGSSGGGSGPMRNVRNVVTGLLEKKRGPRTDGKDAVTGAYLTQASGAEIGSNVFNPNRGLTPQDPKWNPMTASPGYKQTQLSGGGVRTENKSVVHTTQQAPGPARSSEYNTRLHAGTTAATLAAPRLGGTIPVQTTTGAPGQQPVLTGLGTASQAAYNPKPYSRFDLRPVRLPLF